ncbi:sulfite exporter TauE/SafE family protein [Aurantiacibacter sp. MUD11]|uniref:sulfite exporter TauE/SafE family protein n=1 Tax=Aurantiacibacter sp. MUD11 TaxID=3003265 RepID=UPI0022AB11C6|nr:sulfite exporter TauE/SafE family protein [Aurantiacibacter sp. MUD11]WAT17063.1 sulfite exporter TauE/SafE family protein [Aurantiacibacter sp. MUD11]
MELLAGFTAVQIAIAVAATLGAAFIRGLTGFGFGIILVPILALALTPVQAVLAINIMAGLLAFSEIRLIVKNAEKSAITISVLVLLATAPGLMLLDATPPALARLLIALVALSAFFAVLLPRRAADQPGALTTGLTGLSAGILTGFAAMPGPPVVPYYVGRDIPRVTAKASMVAVFGVAAFAGVSSGAAIGVLETRVVVLGLALFPVVLFGNWVGSLAFGKVSDKLWRTFVGVVLGAAAVAALVKLV